MATAGAERPRPNPQAQGPQFARVLSFGVIQGGTSFNIIPERVTLEGTVRTVQADDRELMIRLLHQAFQAAADLHGGSYQLEYTRAFRRW